MWQKCCTEVDIKFLLEKLRSCKVLVLRAPCSAGLLLREWSRPALASGISPGLFFACTVVLPPLGSGSGRGGEIAAGISMQVTKPHFVLLAEVRWNKSISLRIQSPSTCPGAFQAMCALAQLWVVCESLQEQTEPKSSLGQAAAPRNPSTLEVLCVPRAFVF